MKVIAGIAVLLLVAVSCLADYRWKKWIAARKRERDHSTPPGSYRR